VHSSGSTRSPSGPAARIVFRHQYCAIEGDFVGSPTPNASGESHVFVRMWRQSIGSASGGSPPEREKRRIGARGSSVIPKKQPSF
jgi:hypothetical protein